MFNSRERQQKAFIGQSIKLLHLTFEAKVLLYEERLKLEGDKDPGKGIKKDRITKQPALTKRKNTHPLRSGDRTSMTN